MSETPHICRGCGTQLLVERKAPISINYVALALLLSGMCFFAFWPVGIVVGGFFVAYPLIKKLHCPKCHGTDLFPTDTPIGRKMLEEMKRSGTAE